MQIYMKKLYFTSLYKKYNIKKFGYLNKKLLLCITEEIHKKR